MNYSEIKTCDIANGAGVRTSVFVSGCELGCSGCFNSEAWDFGAGRELTEDVVREVMESMRPPYVDGLSVLGGEPLHPRNLDGVRRLMRAFRDAYGTTKDIWLWTGHTWESLTDGQMAVARCADVLVDGPFVDGLKDLTLRFRGSSNQRIIDVAESLRAGCVTEWTDAAPFATHEWVVDHD